MVKALKAHASALVLCQYGLNSKNKIVISEPDLELPLPLLL